MNIHEYQGKEILRKYNVPVPRGIPAFSVDEALKAAEQLGGPVWVVKAQIHAGGRGKGGGVKVAKSMDEVKTYASNILGMQLVTHQTGPEGKKVNRLLIEEGADIKKELYVSLVTDRVSQRVVLMASSEGGMDIEEVANTVRERAYVQRQVRVLSAEGRLSIAILSALPFGIFFYLALMNPEYVSPLFTTTMGRILLLVGGSLMAVGIFVMTRIVRIDV